MGGGDDAPTPPNYQPIIDGLTKVIDKSLATSDDQMAWAKQAYKDNKALGDNIINFSLGQLDKMATWADNDRKRYEDIYQPLEEQQALRAQDYLTPERQQAEAGKAEADVAAQFETARNTAQQRLEAFGVDPSQTRQGALDLGTRIAESAAAASAGNQARWRTEQYGDQLMANAIATGQHLPQQVMAEASGAASSGNQAVNTGLAETASGAQTMGTPYQWTGMGMQGYGQQAQVMNAGFQNQLDAWKADQSNSSGFGSILGAVTDLATHFLAEGGIPDDNTPGSPGADGEMVPSSASPSGGAIPDDIEAQISPSGRPAKINAGEFIMPKDVVSWLGEKGMQAIVLKARKEMDGGDATRPAQPTSGPPDAGPPPNAGPPPIPGRGIGAIPDPKEAMAS